MGDPSEWYDKTTPCISPFIWQTCIYVGHKIKQEDEYKKRTLHAYIQVSPKSSVENMRRGQQEKKKKNSFAI